MSPRPFTAIDKAWIDDAIREHNALCRSARRPIPAPLFLVRAWLRRRQDRALFDAERGADLNLESSAELAELFHRSKSWVNKYITKDHGDWGDPRVADRWDALRAAGLVWVAKTEIAREVHEKCTENEQENEASTGEDECSVHADEVHAECNVDAERYTRVIENPEPRTPNPDLESDKDTAPTGHGAEPPVQPPLLVVPPAPESPKPKRKPKATPSSELWSEFRDRWKSLHGSELGDNPPKSVGIEARAKDHGPDAVRLLIRWWAESQDSRARFLRENRVEAKTLFGPEKFSEYMAAWVRPWAASTGATPPTANPAPTAASLGALAWADMLTRPHVASPFPEFIGWIVRSPAQWNDPKKVKLAADPVEHGRRLKAFAGPGALGMRWETDHRLPDQRERIRLDFITRYEAQL